MNNKHIIIHIYNNGNILYKSVCMYNETIYQKCQFEYTHIEKKHMKNVYILILNDTN